MRERAGRHAEAKYDSHIPTQSRHMLDRKQKLFARQAEVFAGCAYVDDEIGRVIRRWRTWNKRQYADVLAVLRTV
jgi:arylsulfatase A-like enzyme